MNLDHRYKYSIPRSKSPSKAWGLQVKKMAKWRGGLWTAEQGNDLHTSSSGAPASKLCLSQGVSAVPMEKCSIRYSSRRGCAHRADPEAGTCLSCAFGTGSGGCSIFREGTTGRQSSPTLWMQPNAEQRGNWCPKCQWDTDVLITGHTNVWEAAYWVPISIFNL